VIYFLDLDFKISPISGKAAGIQWNLEEYVVEEVGSVGRVLQGSDAGSHVGQAGAVGKRKVVRRVGAAVG